MRTTHLFISYSWNHGGHYDRLVALLGGRGYFSFKDYSVPQEDPLDARNATEIRTGIERQMRPCSVVLIMAGVHASYSKWMQEEIKIAKKFEKAKPIIAIRPWGAQRISTTADRNADETVSWNTESIVAAIRRHS